MNKLALAIADRVRAQVASPGAAGGAERRLLFLGPPHEIMSEVFHELVRGQEEGVGDGIPFLLQVARETLGGTNPAIGASGWCDEDHLLDLRNHHKESSYVALIPPGEHSILSVSSTTDKFGMAEASNGGNANFEQWWEDSFVQDLVTQGLAQAGLLEAEHEDGRQLVESAANAADEVAQGQAGRQGAWRVLSRLFSADAGLGLSPGARVSLVCGVPPRRNGSLGAKEQLATLKAIAEAMGDGFRSGVDRLSDGATNEDQALLEGFLENIKSTCQVATSFDRSTAEFYRPPGDLAAASAPGWWMSLDVEKWSELLAEEPAVTGDILMTCENELLALGKVMPAIVSGPVRLRFETKGADPTGALIEVSRTPAAGNGEVGSVRADSGDTLEDDSPPVHKSPLSYKATATGFKKGAMKVVSLATWQPGIIVACRSARKFSHPRKPARSTGRGAANWETSLSLPGPGHYELLVLTSPGISLEGSGMHSSEQSDGNRGAAVPVAVHAAGDSVARVELEVEGNCQVDLAFSREGKNGVASTETCRAYLTCEDVPEVGCKSEFERLIKANRRRLEAFDAKAVIPVNRAVRSTMLQDWLLADETVRLSYQPIVLAEDYSEHWAPPSWGGGAGPIMSAGAFIHDPRPAPTEFRPREEFLDAREQIASRVRGEGDQSGVFETARLGELAIRDEEFCSLVEQYVDAYTAWLAADPEVACWCDVIAVASLDASGRSLSREPVALLLSPLHPLRVGWHVAAQRVLAEADEAGKPCPGASVLDPDCVPDILSMYIRSPSGSDRVDYLAVENGTDYWSVLWNGKELDKLPARSMSAPFGGEFGISVGGISVGFSAAQVVRALDDVSDLLAAKATVGVAVSSSGGTSDACNQGLVEWCTTRFQEDARRPRSRAVGPRFVEVYDERAPEARPDDATIANLSEDTRNSVRWFSRQPAGSTPDLGIIAQLDMSEPRSERVEGRTPLGAGALLRHRVRRQLGTFLTESRQGSPCAPTGEVLDDKVAALAAAMENLGTGRSGLQFAPNVHEVRHMLRERNTDFVAVSSSAIDPACFLGGWLEGAYLWDFDLPSYSHRAGDTNGYYLLSQVTEADRVALGKALARLPGCSGIEDERVQEVLLEVARRGIPTIKGLAGDDAGATGDLGIFVAVRLLQDRFRAAAGGGDGILEVVDGTADDATLAIIVPVDPFRGYISDLRKALGQDKGDFSQLRPDLLVVGMSLSGEGVRIKVTPVEVKCRPTSRYSTADAAEALGQARALSELLAAMQPGEGQPRLWALAFQHLLLSIIGFGMRVYSQQEDVVGRSAQWSEFHERVAQAILDGGDCVEVDPRGRLIIVDDSPSSLPRDNDADGFEETVVIGREDAGSIVAGDPGPIYTMVRQRLGDWEFLPQRGDVIGEATVPPQPLADEPGPAPDEASDEAPEPAGRQAEAVPSAIAAPPAPAAANPDPLQAPPGQSTGIVLRIGTTIDGFRPRDLQLNISDTRLNQLNMGVVGDLGTGKTQLLKSIITQIASSADGNRGIKPRFLIFDYKRDYSSDDFVAATGARVVRPHRLPLNLFDTRTVGDVPTPWLDRFRFFADVLGKIYPGIGPVQRDKLKRAVKEAYEGAPSGIPPTLRDVHEAYSTILDGKADSPMAIIDDLMDMEIFEPDQTRTVPFDEFLDGVVVIALDALGQDDHSKNMLVAVMLNMFYENMLRTPKRPFLGEAPQLRAVDSYLLVDEADNIMRYEFDVLRKLLLQGREFGTGVILASQYLRHFKAGGTDYREPLLTWFVHKVPNVTASELGALGLAATAAEVAERVKALGNHQCLYKSYDSPGDFVRGYPFFELMREKDGKGS
jgi:hypothetical protein